jgi:hypothetical protein
MNDLSLDPNHKSLPGVDVVASHLRDEYEQQQALVNAQPVMTQRFLEQQARQVGEAIIQDLAQIRFSFPDSVTLSGKQHPVPDESREQLVGGLMDRLTRTEARQTLRQRLSELESASNPALASAASLFRHVLATQLVHTMLPSGRSVKYLTVEGDEIPSIPVASDLEPESAITAATDAIVEEAEPESGRGDLLVPYVPAARRFYLPQWVAFDDEGRLLVNNVNEAEAHIASMQRFLFVLHAAVALAPYIVADDDYQKKRYGMLGQLVNQGRALARFLTDEIIQTIKRRAKANDLNRGLSLSLPFFDDQALEVKTHDFEVIPAGRIMFVPAFVVRAVREEQAKVAQDTRLSPSTRKYLLLELSKLEEAFEKFHLR